MIKIEHHKVELDGDIDELQENLMDFIMFIVYGEERENDYKYNKLFSIEGILRGLYTGCSTQQSIYLKLLETNKKVLSEIESGKFKLVYKELGHDIDISTITFDRSEYEDD